MIITTCIRRMGEGTVITGVCLFTPEGVPPSSQWGVIHSSWWGGCRPPSFLMGVPHPFQDPFPEGTPSARWVYLPVGTGWGNPPIRTGWGYSPVVTGWGYCPSSLIRTRWSHPRWDWMGVPLLIRTGWGYLIRGGRNASCVHAGGLSCYKAFLSVLTSRNLSRTFLKISKRFDSSSN